MSFKKENIPAELKKRKQWIIWNEERRGDKSTKVPKAPWKFGEKYRYRADPTDPANWTDFEVACYYTEKKEGYGIGYVITGDDPYTGIDWDDCVNGNGTVEKWVQEKIMEAGSYSELSPSEKGVHTIVKGSLPGAMTQKEGRKHKVEAYCADRFFTVTGRVLRGNENIRENQAFLDELWEEYGEEPKIDYEPKGTELIPILEVVPTEKLEKRGTQLQGSHPIHGSTTGINFAVNPWKNTWFCFRHNCGGGPFEYLAMEEGIIKCGEWGRGESPLKGGRWIQVVEAAERRGVVSEGEALELTPMGAGLTEKQYQELAEELSRGDVTERYLDILRKTVKEEDRLVELGLYHFISAYTPDPMNLGLEAPTSEGKTYPMVEIAKRFPQEDVWYLGGLSPTALAHDYGKLVDKKTGTPLSPMISKLYDELDEAEKDQRKKIKRKIKKIQKKGKYVIDLEGRIIIFLEAPSPETFARLRPILSHDTWEISYKFTDKTRSGSLRQMTTTIRGWPVAVFFKAKRTKRDQQIWDEIESRFTTISPKMKPEKYRAAVEFIAEKKGTPSPVLEAKLGLEDYERMEKKIKAIKRRLLEITTKARENSRLDAPNIFWIPFRDEIGKEFPATVGRHMRDSQRFLTAMQMSAAVNVFNRPILEMGGSESIVVTRRDYERALDLFFDEGSETIFTGIPGHIIGLFKKVLVPLGDERFAKLEDEEQTKLGDKKQFKDVGEPFGITISEMVDEYRRVFKKSISSKTIYNHYLPPLEDHGLISKEKNPDDKRSNIYKVLQREILAKDIPICSLFENGNNFSEETLKTELNKLRKIFPLKVILHNKKLPIESLWKDHYYKSTSGGNIKEGQKEGDFGDSSDKRQPKLKSGINGNNLVGKEEGIGISEIQDKLLNILSKKEPKPSELTEYFDNDDLVTVNNTLVKWREDGMADMDEDRRWRLNR